MFLSFFALIFLAALPGRTTFLLLTLSAGGEKSKMCSLALVVHFSFKLSSQFFWGERWRVFRLRSCAWLRDYCFFTLRKNFGVESGKSSGSLPKEQSIGAVFILIFIAELGDVSQLAIASIATKAAQPAKVLIAAIAALFTLTLIAVVFGKTIGKLVRPSVVQKFASGIFLLIGLYLIFSAVTSSFKYL